MIIDSNFFIGDHHKFSPVLSHQKVQVLKIQPFFDIVDNNTYQEPYFHN